MRCGAWRDRPYSLSVYCTEAVQSTSAVVITETEDEYRDLVVWAISSVLPTDPSSGEILVTRGQPHLFSTTGLRVDSVIKIDRIATLRQSDVITTIGRCPPPLWQEIVGRFRGLL